MNQVKIVATIGPKTNTQSSILALKQSGMNVARLNGSHSDLIWHKNTINLLRETAPDVPILLDIPGRKVRIQAIPQDLTFQKGQVVVFSPDASDNNINTAPITYPDFHQDLSPGDVILAQDGIFKLSVEEISNTNVVCRALSPGTLISGAGIHVQNVDLHTDLLSEKDNELIDFACKNEIDFLGASFVDTAEDVESVRSLIGGRRRLPRIVSKVETRQAMTNLQELIEASDALMIDRGDLALQAGFENVALLQKRILSEARAKACPVIVATEVLHSMTVNPVPTKAELTDITTCVLDGASAMMLSGETAIGDYPVETVRIMRQVADAASASLKTVHLESTNPSVASLPEVMGDAVALICNRLEVTKIIAVTSTGYAARNIASKMPDQPILAVSNHPATARSFNLLRGTTGHYVDFNISTSDMNHIPLCLEELWRRGELIDDDLVLVTAVSYPNSGNRMNLIETHQVSDLRDGLGWHR